MPKIAHITCYAMALIPRIMRNLVVAKKINNVEIFGLVDVSTNPPTTYCLCETEERAKEILKIIKDNEAHENRIRVLSNLNKKYREQLELSNEPMDLDLLTPLT